MTPLIFKSTSLKARLQISLWRHGWVWLPLLSLVVSLFALYVIYLPEQQEKLEAMAQSVKFKKNQYLKLQQMPLAVTAPFYEEEVLQQLGNQVFAEADVGIVLKRMTLIGQGKGLVLSQSEFQTVQKTLEGQLGLRQVQVTLPVRASYTQLRQFIQETLSQFGAVSVDQISIKRENVAQNQLDVKIKLSIWIDANKPSSHLRIKP